jgi:hypothetical protein
MRLLLHAFVVLAAAGIAFLRAPAVCLIVVGAMVTASYYYLGWLESRGPLPVTPISVHFFWYGAVFGVASIHFGLARLQNEPIIFIRTALRYEDVQSALVISLVGSLALHVALQFMKPERVRVPSQPAELRTLFTFLLFLVGLLFLGLSNIIPGQTSVPFGMRGLGSILMYLPYAILMRVALLNNRFALPKLIAGTILTVVAAALSASKGNVMFSLFPLGVWCWNRSRKMAVLYGFLAVFLYLAAVAPLVNSYRSLGHAPEDPLSVSEQWDGFMDRIFEVEPVAFIVSDVDAGGFKYGSIMSNPFYSLVPRVLWEDKPMMGHGLWFSVYLGLAASEDTATTSTVMTAPGELYWNFGFAGVIFGMLLIGIAYGGLWRISISTCGLHTLKGMLIYFICTAGMIGSPEASSMLVVTITLYLFIFLLLAFRQQRAFRKEQAAASVRHTARSVV